MARGNGGIGKSIFLLILIIILVLGGLLWFDYLGVIHAKKVFAPVYKIFGLAPQTSVTATTTKPLTADLDEDRLAKRIEALDIRTQELDKREGDIVKKGQAVATLYAPDMIAKADQVKAPRDLAQKSYARIQELYEGGVVSAQKLDEAQAKVQQAEGAVDATLTFVDEMTLYSPVDGEVSTVVLENSELASPGISVLTVLDTNDVWATFNVREDLLNNFQINENIDITIPALGGQNFPFRVTYISKQGDYAVWSATKTHGEFDLKTFEVRAKPVHEIPNIRRGMTAVINIKP